MFQLDNWGWENLLIFKLGPEQGDLSISPVVGGATCGDNSTNSDGIKLGISIAGCWLLLDIRFPELESKKEKEKKTSEGAGRGEAR